MGAIDQTSYARLEAEFDFDLPAGEVRDGDIRYLLMRPDVLMGMFRNLAPEQRQRALEAFEESAYENGKASMREYRKLEFSGPSDMLSFFCTSAARLGWGEFSYEIGQAGIPVFTVHNSPFAVGYGASETPVCAPITGILKAFVEVFFGESLVLREVACASQGAKACRFEIVDEVVQGVGL